MCRHSEAQPPEISVQDVPSLLLASSQEFSIDNFELYIRLVKVGWMRGRERDIIIRMLQLNYPDGAGFMFINSEYSKLVQITRAFR